MTAGARPLRVAFFPGGLAFGGGEKVLVEQARALGTRGARLDAWLLGPPLQADLAQALREASPGTERIESLPDSAAVRRVLRERRYDLAVTCQSVRAYRAILARRRVPFARAPAVLETVHERYAWSLDDPEGRRRRVVDAWMLTYDFRETLRGALGVPPDRMVVARPLFPSLLVRLDEAARAEGRRLREAWGVRPTAVVVGYLGRLAGNKGLVHLPPMVGRLVRGGADVHLVLAGRVQPADPAFEADLEASLSAAVRAEPLLGGRVHRPGPLPSTAAALAAFDVVPLCARIEGLLPLMLVEAMSAGIAVVTTDVGGIGGCLRDGVDAAVVHKVPDDEAEPTAEVLAAFESRLRTLVLDPAERARLGSAGERRVRHLVGSNDFHGDFLAAADLALSRRR